MQDILDVIVSRHSIKKFKPQMFKKEVRKQILKNAGVVGARRHWKLCSGIFRYANCK